MIRNRSNENEILLLKREPSGAAVMQVSVTDALVRSLFMEWAASGYAALSLERVAKRAQVGKAALYRRWPSKAAMVCDCMSRVGLTITRVPDTGTLRGDIRGLLLSIRRVLRHPVIRRILLDLHAEMARSEELKALIQPFQQARRRQLDAVLDRAIERGEVFAELDRDMVADMIGATIYWRMTIVGGKADIGYIDRLTEMLEQALAPGPA